MGFPALREEKHHGTFDFPLELYHVESTHPRYEMPFHWHMECELMRVCRGEFRLIVDGEARLLRSGQLAYIPEGSVHGGHPERCVYECVVFDAGRFFHDGTICRGMLRQIPALAAGPTVFAPNDDAGYVLNELFLTIGKKPLGYELVATGLLWQFMGSLRRLYADGNQAAPVHDHGRRVEAMKRVLRKIRSEYHKPLSLDVLAEQADMSPKYFCRAFRIFTGRTPIDYLNYYRVKCAAELLKNTNESVTGIALSCGYSDSAYFSRTFSKYKGMSPTQYRGMSV